MVEGASAIIDIEDGDTGLIRVHHDDRLPGLPVRLTVDVSGIPTDYVDEPLVEAWLSRDSAMRLVDLLLRVLNPPEDEKSVEDD